MSRRLYNASWRDRQRSLGRCVKCRRDALTGRSLCSKHLRWQRETQLKYLIGKGEEKCKIA